MTNLASALKAEISRLARKEIRAEVTQLRKAAAQHRSTIAALRKQLQALSKQVRDSSKRDSAPEESSEEPTRHRFRVQGLITLRKKLGLSAEDFGKLVGVTGQSIYKWEADRARPRASQVEALARIRGIGKREAMQRLQELEAAEAKPAATRKRARL